MFYFVFFCFNWAILNGESNKTASAEGAIPKRAVR